MIRSMSQGNKCRTSSKLSLSTRFVCVWTSFSTNVWWSLFLLLEWIHPSSIPSWWPASPGRGWWKKKFLSLSKKLLKDGVNYSVGRGFQPCFPSRRPVNSPVFPSKSHTLGWALFVYYESIKREVNKRLIFECRCDGRLKAKVEGCTHLTYTMWCEEP